MRKLNAWIPEPELEAVQEIKGDISTSLFVRRALKKAVNEARKALSEGDRLPAKTPRAAIVPNANTTTPQADSKEVEVS
ncbi:MAG: hypothetical protein M3275_00215 [Thermoproteota archaeon]|nr:hypothetical protein [Thermoproteota archaeon]